MIRGETVEVWVYTDQGRDALNNPVRAWRVEAVVPNVIVAPSSTSDLAGTIRPDGVEVVLVLHFPKTYSAPLRGRRVKVRGVFYEVIGDPIAYQQDMTPGEWDRPVNVTTTRG